MTKGRNVGVRGAALQEEQLEQAGEEREREREKEKAGSQVNAVSQGGWEGC